MSVGTHRALRERQNYNILADYTNTWVKNRRSYFGHQCRSHRESLYLITTKEVIYLHLLGVIRLRRYLLRATRGGTEFNPITAEILFLKFSFYTPSCCFWALDRPHKKALQGVYPCRAFLILFSKRINSDNTPVCTVLQPSRRYTALVLR